MDGFTLRAAALAAGERYGGARVNDARWVLPGALQLDLDRRLPELILSVHPSLYGLFTAVRGAGEKAGLPPGLALLPQRLKGARLVAVSSMGVERVVRFVFERVSPGGRAERQALILEAISRWSNLILTREPGDAVFLALKVIAGGEGRRCVLPGEKYEPPPAAGRRDPSSMAPGELAAFLEKELPGKPAAGELASLLAGLSPETAADILRSAGRGRSAEKVAAIIVSLVAEPPREGFVVSGPRGPRLALAVPGVVPAGAGERQPLLEAAGMFWAEASRSAGADRKIASILTEANRRLKQAQKLKMKLGYELREAEEADELQRRGSLIMAHLREVKRGAADFTVKEAFGVPGDEVTVPLDPGLGPVANAQRCYRRAKKLRSRAAQLPAKLAEVEAGIARLEEVKRRLGEERDMERLEALAASLAGLLKKEKAKRKPAALPPKRERRWIEYVIAGGWRILVGKDAASNDYLMARQSSPEDIWCHAEGYAGAHVILKVKSAGASFPEAAVMDACRLAALHSKAGGQAKVDVAYTRRKHVRKPRGAAPGLVVLRQRKSMVVRPGVPDGAKRKE